MNRLMRQMITSFVGATRRVIQGGFVNPPLQDRIISDEMQIANGKSLTATKRKQTKPLRAGTCLLYSNHRGDDARN